MKKIKIGRGSNNDVVINDSVVSTNHAVITVGDLGEVTIEDLKSTNGTRVNGKIVSKAVLKSSDTVHLGNHSIDWKNIVQQGVIKDGKVPVSIPSDVVDHKIIGRGPMSQIRYSFDDVSDKHAYICKKSNGDVVLIDNNSTNGTFVNGLRILSPYTLKKGDIVSIANKHPFNWEAIYPLKLSLSPKYIISIAASILVIAGVFISQPWTWFEKSWTEIYKEHKNDVVLIYVQDTYLATVHGNLLSTYLDGYDGLDMCYIDAENDIVPGVSVSYGTGFFISEDGKFLTNRHVVSCSGDQAENEAYIRSTIQSVLNANGLEYLADALKIDYTVLSVGIVQNDKYIDSENDLIPSTILRVSDNPELDVALLQTNTKMLPQGSTFVDLSKAISSEDIVLGYGVCSIGFPKSFVIGETSVGLEANNQSGEVTQERGAYEYGHNIAVHQGASGSPVYDKKGRFAGIIVSGFLGISNSYNQAIHPDPVVDFVEKAY